MEKLILECIVRSALIAICTAVALYLLRVKAARVRHGVWTSVVVLMLVQPVWIAWGPKAVLRVLQPAPAVAEAPASVVMMQTVADPDGPASPVRSTLWTWQNSLLALYLVGFVALFARLMTGTVRAGSLVRRAANHGGRLTSDSCVAPITVGWFAPSVILPDSWTRWSREQLSAVLAHEDEHARQRDPLVQWLALLNRAVFWFHPLAWWLERRLSALSEEACDDAVLGRGHDPVAYSECLLGLARIVQESGARVTAVGMAMPGTFLPQRIRRIVEGAPVQRVSRVRLVSVGAVCAVVSTVFTAGAVGYAAQEVRAVEPVVIMASQEDASAAPSSRGSETAVRKMQKPPVLLAQAPASDGRFTRTDGLHLSVTGQSLAGMVLDPSNAVVAGAPVTLTNSDTGVSVSTTSDNTGMFRFGDIQPATYSVTVRAPGFKSQTQTNIAVAAGEAHSAGRMLLALGQVSESINVTGSRSAAAQGPMVRNSGPMTTLGPVTNLTATAGTLDQATAETRYRAVVNRQFDQVSAGGPVHLGGNVQASKIMSQVKPVYPVDLQQEGIQGTVKIEAVIGKEGLLSDIQVIPGNADSRLTQPALDAVKQWKYKPTLLNGEPVEVLTTIDVNYLVTN